MEPSRENNNNYYIKVCAQQSLYLKLFGNGVLVQYRAFEQYCESSSFRMLPLIDSLLSFKLHQTDKGFHFAKELLHPFHY